MSGNPELVEWLAGLLLAPGEVCGLKDRLGDMEITMSELTDAVTDLTGAVGEVATKLDEQADRIEALEAGSAEAGAAASSIRGLAAQLRDSVANPDLPDEPPVEPAPEG